MTLTYAINLLTEHMIWDSNFIHCSQRSTRYVHKSVTFCQYYCFNCFSIFIYSYDDGVGAVLMTNMKRMSVIETKQKHVGTTTQFQ